MELVVASAQPSLCRPRSRALFVAASSRRCSKAASFLHDVGVNGGGCGRLHQLMLLHHRVGRDIQEDGWFTRLAALCRSCSFSMSGRSISCTACPTLLPWLTCSGLDERLLREASDVVYSNSAVQFAQAQAHTFIWHCLEYFTLQSCARFSIPSSCTVFDNTLLVVQRELLNKERESCASTIQWTVERWELMWKVGDK